MREREQAEAAHQESLLLRKEAEELHREMAELRAGARQKARDEARRIIEKARRESAAVLDELKNLKLADPNAANQLKRRLLNLQDELSGGNEVTDLSDGPKPEKLQMGMRVLLAVSNSEATLLSLPDAKGEVQVQAGIVKLRVPVDELRFAPERERKKETIVRSQTGAGERSVKSECDVRGMALDEAIAAVDSYLDNATLAGLNEVYIIHGKGTGTLRSGLRTYLNRHPHISGQRAGRYGEGEAGVTVVTLR